MGRISTVGMTLAIASTYGSSKNMTAITNANPAVATLEASHGVIVGDIIEISSGWARLDGRLARVSVVNTNDVTLEGINTLDTNQYPAGSGTGTVREITAWTEITQVDAISTSGGEQQFVDGTFMSQNEQVQVPTTRSPVAMTVTVFDDPSLGWYSTVYAADDARTPYGMRLTTSGGAKTYGNAYWTLSKIPQVNKNDLMRANLSMSHSAQPTRYAS